MLQRNIFCCIAMGTLLAACSRDALSPADGGADSSTGRDLAVTVDALAQRDGASCGGTHTLTPTTLSMITAVDPGPPWYGAALRIHLFVSLSPCDLAGPVDVQVMPGNATDVVVVTASVWRASYTCGAPRTVPRNLDLADYMGLSSPTVIVRDGAMGGSASLTLQVMQPISQDCSATQIGATCQTTCQCRAGGNPLAACIPVAAGMGRCGMSCNVDGDCQLAGTLPSCGTTQWAQALCGPGPSCATDGDCPYDQSCQMVQGTLACRSKGQFTSLAMCSCDGDCQVGESCATGGGNRCAILCGTTGDCPQSFVCVTGTCIQPI